MISQLKFLKMIGFTVFLAALIAWALPLLGNAGKPGLKDERKPLYYRNPMGQPDISQVPKKDSMGMDYIPVYAEDLNADASTVPGHSTVKISSGDQQLLGMRTEAVGKRLFSYEIRTIGRVAHDDELYDAQQEYLQAFQMYRVDKSLQNQKMLDRTKRRLILLGMVEDRINELARNAPRDRRLLPEPPQEKLHPGQAWIYVTLYEYEAAFVKIGASVEVTMPAFAGRVWTGSIALIDPVWDHMERTLRARALVDDPEHVLKPEMVVDLKVKTPTGESPAVPDEAVLFTGERAIVFVTPDGSKFEPREISTGIHEENFYEVKSGLKEGERVVLGANFLLDSESRLQAVFKTAASGGSGHEG